MAYALDYDTPVKAMLGQQYILEKGLKKFGRKGYEAVKDEMGQLDDRGCFRPTHVKDLNGNERKRAQRALAYLTEKRDGRIKGQTVYNGKPTRVWMEKEDSTSPTASLESLFLLAGIDAHEIRDVMVNDVPNAFIQAPLILNKEDDHVIMKITGVLVNMLVERNPARYKDYVVFENGKKVIYIELLKVLYGMLNASLLWYKKSHKDLKGNCICV